jgi:tetratricopeptide (TPR) repeat protein
MLHLFLKLSHPGNDSHALIQASKPGKSRMILRSSGYFSGLVIHLVLAFAALCISAPAQDLSATIFGQGMQFYSVGDFHRASDCFDQVVAMNQQHDQARYYLIFSLSQSGKDKKALQHARILAQRFPQMQQYQLLVKQLEQRQFSPTVAVTRNENSEKGDEKIEKVKTDEVKPIAKQQAKRQPDELDQISTLIDEENYSAAIAALEKLLKKSPGNARALHYLGVAAFNQGQFSSAAQHFEKSISSGNKDFEARFLAGSCYMNTREFTKAEEHFKKALDIKDDIFSKLNLAEIQLKTSRFNEAEKIYKAIQQSHPDVIEAKTGLAEILFEQGNIDAASKAINEVLGERSDSAKARFIKARILIDSKLYSEAAEEAKIAVDSNPGSAEFRACLALALIRNFQVAQGLEEARSALRLQADSIDARLALAEGHIVSGDAKSAKEQLDAAEKSGKHPGTSFLLANLAMNKDDQKLAKQHYYEYRQRSNGQPRALLDFARFHEAIGSFEEAASAYHEIIEKHGQTIFADEARTATERLAHAENRPAKPAATRIPIPGLLNP